MIPSLRKYFFLMRLSAQLVKRAARMTLFGSIVPGGIIIELTSSCSIQCRGCYMPKSGPVRRMSPETLSRLLSETASIGIPHVSFSGGEPLIEVDMIFQSLAGFPQTSFSIATNGTLITREIISRLSDFPNVQLILSTDGPSASTRFRSEDSTRHLLEAAALLKGSGIRYGASTRVYQENIDEVASPAFLAFLTENDFSFSAFSPLLPYAPESGNLSPLSPSERKRLDDFCATSRKTSPLEIIVPCLDAGTCAGGARILSVTPDGWILPCPHIPWKRHRFPEHSLKEALESEFFTDFRRPAEGRSSPPCFVLDKPDSLQAIITRNKATHLPHSR